MRLCSSLTPSWTPVTMYIYYFIRLRTQIIADLNMDSLYNFPDPNLDSRYNLYLELSWPQLELPLQPVYIFDKTLFINHSWPHLGLQLQPIFSIRQNYVLCWPHLDYCYNLYLVSYRTIYIDNTWPQLGIALQPIFIFNKTMLIDHSWP